MSEAPLFPPALNGTEQRLDALLAELRALRTTLTPSGVPVPADTLMLQEPKRGPGRPRKTER